MTYDEHDIFNDICTMTYTAVVMTYNSAGWAEVGYRLFVVRTHPDDTLHVMRCVIEIFDMSW